MKKKFLRKGKDDLEKEKAALPTECGQKVNFTLKLKEDEGCPARQESGRVADVLLCLLGTRVLKQSPESPTPLRCKAAKRPARIEHRQKKN
jgi:hypothetical protein